MKPLSRRSRLASPIGSGERKRDQAYGGSQVVNPRYRFIVMFEPDRPLRPSEYIREVEIDSLYPEDAVRAALDRLASEPGHGTKEPVRFWQADRLVITVRRSA